MSLSPPHTPHTFVYTVPEEWEKKVQEMYQKYSRTELIDHFHTFRETQPAKWMKETNVEDCTGDGISNSKNAQHCFDSEELEDCKFCYDLKAMNGVKNFNNYDVTHFGGISHCYECLSI